MGGAWEFINIMSEEESSNQEPMQLKDKEEAERKYGCPCGKWYLSYPALFTHVKQKHDGKVHLSPCSRQEP